MVSSSSEITISKSPLFRRVSIGGFSSKRPSWKRIPKQRISRSARLLTTCRRRRFVSAFSIRRSGAMDGAMSRFVPSAPRQAYYPEVMAVLSFSAEKPKPYAWRHWRLLTRLKNSTAIRVGKPASALSSTTTSLRLAWEKPDARGARDVERSAMERSPSGVSHRSSPTSVSSHMRFV